MRYLLPSGQNAARIEIQGYGCKSRTVKEKH
jgi:hypothetical protein